MPTHAATDFPESFSVAAGFSLAAATPGLETIPIHANATTPSIMRCIVPSLRFRRKTPIPLRSSDRVSPAFHAGGEGAVVGAARRLLLCLPRGHRPTTPVDTADVGRQPGARQRERRRPRYHVLHDGFHACWDLLIVWLHRFGRPRRARTPMPDGAGTKGRDDSKLELRLYVRPGGRCKHRRCDGLDHIPLTREHRHRNVDVPVPRSPSVQFCTVTTRAAAQAGIRPRAPLLSCMMNGKPVCADRLTWLARPSYERHAFGLSSQGGRPMRDRRVAIGVVAVLILSGCSAMRERRWSYCAVAGGLAGAAVGAGTAGGLVNAYEKNRSDEHTGAAA